jgi:hypothetical protein
MKGMGYSPVCNIDILLVAEPTLLQQQAALASIPQPDVVDAACLSLPRPLG